MTTHLEVSLQRDVDRIRERIVDMAGLVERALRDGVRALAENDRKLAYAVILRDQYVDEKEKEIDRLNLELLVRQQPVAHTLRVVYSAIRLNIELERVGDYAESIARQVIKLSQVGGSFPRDRFGEIAENSITMLRDAVRAFVDQDAETARRVMEVEDKVDLLKSSLIKELVNLYRENRIPFEALDPLTMIVRRLERVADQARDICLETVYSSTGQYAKHPGAEVFRVLFVDTTGGGSAAMAETIATGLNESRFVFSSAGLDPRPVRPETAAYLQGRGHDVSHIVPKAITQVPNLEFYHLIIALSPEIRQSFLRRPRNGVFLEWTVPDPAAEHGSTDQLQRAHDQAFRFLEDNIKELVHAVLGT